MAKKTVITYDMVKERTSLTKEQQAKADKKHKIGMALGITGGVLLLGGLAGMVTYFALHKDPQTEYVVKNIHEYSENDNMYINSELFEGVEITFTVKVPKEGNHDEKIYRYTGEYETYATPAELATALKNAGIEEGKSLSKEQFTSMIKDYEFISPEGTELTAHQSQEIIKSVVSSAKSNNPLAKKIFDKLQETRSITNKSYQYILDSYTSKENPNKINIEVTPEEFKFIASNVKTNDKNLLNKINKITQKLQTKSNLKSKSTQKNNLVR